MDALVGTDARIETEHGAAFGSVEDCVDVGTSLDQPLYASEPLPQTARLMLKDEDICVHCGLCADRCPTAAWDMKQFQLLIPYAGQSECSNPVLIPLTAH